MRSVVVSAVFPYIPNENSVNFIDFFPSNFYFWCGNVYSISWCG